jgi:hypothetical protein
VSRAVLRGLIASSGFASGDRVVVGHWPHSPIGPFTDVMWAEPDGSRVLYVPPGPARAFVTAIYDFDRVVEVPLRAATRRLAGSLALSVVAGERRIVMVAGRGVPFPAPRPTAVTRRIEGPVARRLLAVETYGRSPTGVREWYQAERWRPLRLARARVGGRDLGAAAPVWPPVGVGFSEPPRRPSLVEVRTVLEPPEGTRLPAPTPG